MKLLIVLFLLQLAGLGMCIQRFPSDTLDMSAPTAHAAAPSAAVAQQTTKISPRVQAIQIQHKPIVRTAFVQTPKAAPQSHGFFDSFLPSAAKGQNLLQMDHTEIDDIIAQLDTIYADLAALDTADTVLLAEKTGNHTEAIATTTAANASLAAAQTHLTSEQAAHTTELATLATETSAANDDIALCLSELTYANNMQSALDSLKAVGGGSLIQIGSTPQQQLIAMANQLTSSIRPQFKDSVALIQRTGYTEASTVESGISALITEINAQKAAAELRIVTQQAAVTAAAAAVQTASDDVVLMETRQAAAMVEEHAALLDLLTTTTDVALSTTDTQSVRDMLDTIKAQLEAMRAVAATDTNFVQVGKFMNMLDVGVQNYNTIKTTIQNIIMNLFMKIDVEKMNESVAKTNRYSEMTALQSAQVPLIEDSDVKDAQLTTLDTNIAQALGVLDSANAALATEVSAQLSEKAAITQLTTIFDTMSGGGGGGEIMLQTQRDHTDFVAQFHALITTIETNMETAKNTLQADVDRDQSAHATLVNSRLGVALAAEQAEIAEQNALAATAAATAVYMTSTQRYMANSALRNQEQTILMNLQVLVNNLSPPA